MSTPERNGFPRRERLLHRLGCDSVVQALGYAFRLPDSLYHFLSYIGEGDVFFIQSENQWAVKEKWNREGVWELGYGREQFTVWMQRQISRLENAWP